MSKKQVDKRLDVVKDILRDLASKYSDLINFVFITDEPKIIGDSNFIYSISSCKSAFQIDRVNKIIIDNYLLQAKYKTMAVTSEALIVVCSDDRDLPSNYKKLLYNTYYKVLDIAYDKGNVFYELEGLNHSGVVGYKGYNSKRFRRVAAEFYQN